VTIGTTADRRLDARGKCRKDCMRGKIEACMTYTSSGDLGFSFGQSAIRGVDRESGRTYKWL